MLEGQKSACPSAVVVFIIVLHTRRRYLVTVTGPVASPRSTETRLVLGIITWWCGVVVVVAMVLMWCRGSVVGMLWL